MGRYYDLINITKKHQVSHDWGTCPPDYHDLIELYHLYGWNASDLVVSSCYCESLKWNATTNEWEEFEYDENEAKKYVIYIDPEDIGDGKERELIDELKKTTNRVRCHYPLWNDDDSTTKKCLLCGFKYSDDIYAGKSY